MKSAVLLVSFGSSHADARENSLQKIAEAFKKAEPDMAVYQAYTSSMIIHKLAKEAIKINTVEEAVKEVLDNSVRRLYVIPTHMIPGREYKKMLNLLEPYRTAFEQVLVSEPVLAKESDCGQVAGIMQRLLHWREDYEYVLMGHGSDAEANIRYQQMNEAFEKRGLYNIRIASVEAKPDLEDALLQLAKRKTVKKVVLHPFMVVAGDHAKNDMAGEEDSYLTRLREAGYTVEAVIKGLGEYDLFRQIYIDKLRRMMKGKLYGVGVGPGEPELMTYKAAKIIKACDVIGIPAKSVDTCTAFRIAKEAVPEIGNKEILTVPVSMTTDKNKLQRCYDKGAKDIALQLEKGKNVAFLNLGDPTIYGTYMRLHRRVQKAGYEAHIVSGVPSFCAVAAALDISLAEVGEQLHIIPGFYGIESVQGIAGTKVIMKPAGKLGEVKEALEKLEEQGGQKAYAVTNCGMEEETICRELHKLDTEAGYFTTIIVKECTADEEDKKGKGHG